ncbi:MAG: hypothetical protein ACREAF_06395 [Nitrosopumilaceae archaeon]
MDRAKGSDKTRSKSKSYDHNNPVSICSVCFTLGGWHCFECSKDFCNDHFASHKELQLCVAHRTH